ncbi:MAG: GspB domain-containing protein [Planctomycetes bacterium]|nr:GspB domain-containing protein [Planctomycetota bacterium]
MSDKKLIIWVLVAVITITTCNCLATENQPTIESRISQRRHKIEDPYMKRILDSRLRAASEVRLLEVAETSKPNWADINEWADFAETVLQINGCERESFSLYKVTTETSAQRLAVALSRIAKRKNDILSRSKFEAFNLDTQKEYALNAELTELEKTFKDAPTPKTKVTHGLVAGIVYSPDKSSAVVNNKIVHEGDTIQGVAVVKIYEDKVIFEKSGNRWEQAVQQTPDAYWR